MLLPNRLSMVNEPIPPPPPTVGVGHKTEREVEQAAATGWAPYSTENEFLQYLLISLLKVVCTRLVAAER